MSQPDYTSPYFDGIHGQQFPPAQPQYYPPTAPPNPEKNGFGLTSVIVGGVGLLFCLMPLTGFIGVGLGFIGIIFGVAGISRVRNRRATNMKTAVTGLILSIAAMIFGFVAMMMFFNAVDNFGDDLNQISTDMDNYSNCLDSTPSENWDTCN